MVFPNTTGNQLGVLGSKIQYDDGIVGRQHVEKRLSWKCVREPRS